MRIPTLARTRLTAPALLLVLVMAAGCSAPLFAPRATQTNLTYASVYAVQISVKIGNAVSTAPTLDAGSGFDLVLDFLPGELRVYSDPSGEEKYTQVLPWEQHPVRQMQVCVSVGQVCELGAEWQPFQSPFSVHLTADWAGPRYYYFKVAFRDASGAPVNSFYSNYRYSTAKAVTSYRNTITAQINPALPPDQQPDIVRTAIAAAQSAYPVSGEVQIEGGRFAAGGTAGSQITLSVQYSAASAHGRVVEMRTQPVGSCRQPELSVNWEPFSPEKRFTTTLALNWVGFYVAAQFKDEQGNLSVVVCDDISLEGNPARTP